MNLFSLIFKRSKPHSAVRITRLLDCAYLDVTRLENLIKERNKQKRISPYDPAYRPMPNLSNSNFHRSAIFLVNLNNGFPTNFPVASNDQKDLINEIEANIDQIEQDVFCLLNEESLADHGCYGPIAKNATHFKTLSLSDKLRCFFEGTKNQDEILLYLKNRDLLRLIHFALHEFHDE